MKLHYDPKMDPGRPLHRATRGPPPPLRGGGWCPL